MNDVEAKMNKNTYAPPGIRRKVASRVETTLPPQRNNRMQGCVIREYSALAEPMSVPILREKIEAFAVQANATAADICDIKIAVGEAVANAYKHGSPLGRENRIHVRCTICAQTLSIEVQDEGQPFDSSSIEIPNPHELRDHGMGIYMMRHAMDTVDFESNAAGNRVVMTKLLGAHNTRTFCISRTTAANEPQ